MSSYQVFMGTAIELIRQNGGKMTEKDVPWQDSTSSNTG